MIAPTCDHFETRGVVLAELGQADDHLVSCPPCRVLRDRHRSLALALAAIGDDHRPRSDWQTLVWARIDHDDAQRRQHRGYRLAAVAALVSAAAALILYVRAPGAAGSPPRIEIVAGATAMRSTSARVGDRIRVHIDRDSAVWLYREDRTLIGRCEPMSPGPLCAPSRGGLSFESALVAPGRYQVVVVPRGAPVPTGNLDRDVAAVAGLGLEFRLTEIDVW